MGDGRDPCCSSIVKPFVSNIVLLSLETRVFSSNTLLSNARLCQDSSVMPDHNVNRVSLRGGGGGAEGGGCPLRTFFSPPPPPPLEIVLLKSLLMLISA